MDIKNFVLSYYKNSAENFHIHKVEKTVEAQKPHTHEYFQIYYIVKGRITHYVSNSSSTLSHGDMFIIPPGVIHHIAPLPGTVFYSLSFMSDLLGEPTKANRLAINFLKSLKQSIQPKISIISKDIFYAENIMEHMLNEFNGKTIGYDENIRAYTLILVNLLARSYLNGNWARIPEYFEDNRQFVIGCVEYVENNFTDKISLDDISKRAAMSKGTFCKLFTELTGHSFNNYINICRIKKAAEYISQGYKITAIYGLCGYGDFSTFYRNFKKIMGISPKEFKEMPQKS
ncbi:MAG: helix-turn-helix domain-containing protein [Clostridia bacterium]|nr:helix-turn-helix domain-containing protein [Clostridia bacterium]